MREIYDEYFSIPKSGKIREKAMLTRVTMTVVVVVLCLAAMGLTAYAYFSYNVTSGSTILKSANFETKVSVTVEPQTTAEDGTVKVITSNYRSHLAKLDAGITYKVTLTPTERSTAETGFVVVTAENCKSKYHTQQLGVDGDTVTSEITFYIKANEATKVTFLAHWGTSSHYDDYMQKGDQNTLYITQEETVELLIDVPESTEPSTPEATDPTQSTTESPTVPETENTEPVPEVTVPEGTVPEETVPEETVPEETVPEETVPEEIVHTIQPDETLTDIAKLYDTTIERLVAYNGLADKNNIQSGRPLLIPSADWVMPEATEPATETTVPETTAPIETTAAPESTETTGAQ